MLKKIICTQKKLNLQFAKKYPLNYLKKNTQPSNCSFEKSLSKSDLAFILECKASSLNDGLLTETYNPVSQAKHYEPFANAISVLTNAPYFKGQYEHMKSVKEKTQLPVLCKDFILSPYQVYLARYFGADAVLLIVAALNDQEIQKCIDTAHLLNVDIFAEINNEEELDRVLKFNIKIIGINNRNLHTLEIDTDTTKQLAPLIGKDKIVISASGIHSHRQIRELRPYVDGFLIGSALNKAHDVQKTLKEIIFGSIKICGITNLKDAQLVQQCGAKRAGIILAPKTPRCVNIETAQYLINEVPMEWVGVFMDQDLDEVVNTIKGLNLTVIQLAGKEDNAFRQSLKSLIGPNLTIIQKIELEDLNKVHTIQFADEYILDLPKDFKAFPTKMTYDLEKLQTMDLSYVHFAGGINCENIKTIKKLNILGIDICSGIEFEVGKKDSSLLNRLLNECVNKERYNVA